MNYLSIPKLQWRSCWSLWMDKINSSHSWLDMWFLSHAERKSMLVKGTIGISVFLINALRPGDAYICVSKQTIFGSDNGLLPGRRQAITEPMLEYCKLDPQEQFSVKIQSKIIHFIQERMSPGKRCPFCPGLNVLRKSYKFEFCYWLT